MSTEDYTISSSDINTIDNALITEQSRLDLKKE